MRAVKAGQTVIPEAPILLPSNAAVYAVGVRHRLRPGVSHSKLQSSCEAAIDRGLQRVVVRCAAVLAQVDTSISRGGTEEVVAHRYRHCHFPAWEEIGLCAGSRIYICRVKLGKIGNLVQVHLLIEVASEGTYIRH